MPTVGSDFAYSRYFNLVSEGTEPLGSAHPLVGEPDSSALRRKITTILLSSAIRSRSETQLSSTKEGRHERTKWMR